MSDIGIPLKPNGSTKANVGASALLSASIMSKISPILSRNAPSMTLILNCGGDESCVSFVLR